MKGEFERRLRGVIDAVKASVDPVILFIDEAHGLIGSGNSPGQSDAANILKPPLARGELRTIAATTWGEYKRHIERDAALTRRFQTIKVDEPDEATAVCMLRAVAGYFEAHHNVRIREEALTAAVRLSARYIPARQLPDKAVSLLDTAAASVSLSRQTVPEALADRRREVELLTTEEERLRAELASPCNTARLAEIAEHRSALANTIAAIEVKYDEETRLVREADALEAMLHGAGAAPAETCVAPRGNAKAGDGADCGTATFQGSCDESAQEMRLALADIEGKLAKAGGQAPLVHRLVDKEVVAAVVSRWTGIPLGRLLSDQVETVKTLDERLKARIVGQNQAIDRIAATMKAARAGLADPRRPPAVFLLVGSSGVGKTETALSLADLLYGGSQHLTTINMSEFKEEHKISMLLGSPPGYVGYGEGGVLTEAVRRRPYGVLLLDEIDKAHPGVQEMFYQVFDRGLLRDGEGRDVDFKNTTILMTANAGAEFLSSLAADPETMPEGEALEALLARELSRHFKPAFLGRTTIIPYMPLERTALSSIVDIQIGRIQERVQAVYGAHLGLSDVARAHLIARAEESNIGARAIETMIARNLLPALSAYFLDTVLDGEKVRKLTIGVADGRFLIERCNPDAERQFAASGNGATDHAAFDPSMHRGDAAAL